MTLVRGASTLRKDGVSACHHQHQSAPSSAFLEKRQKELERLRSRIAAQLIADLQNLYSSSSNANLVIKFGAKSFLVHKEIVQVRNPSLFARLFREAAFTPGCADEDRLPQFQIEFADEDSLDRFFRCLYEEESGAECTKISQSWKTTKDEESTRTEQRTEGPRSRSESSSLVFHERLLPVVDFAWTLSQRFSWLSVEPAQGGGGGGGGGGEKRQIGAGKSKEEEEGEEKHNVVDVRKSSYMQKEEIDEIEANMDKGPITTETRDAAFFAASPGLSSTSSEIGLAGLTAMFAQAEADLTVNPLHPCSALGRDLLALLDAPEMTADVLIKVQEATFRVHRSILAGRSAYFSAMLSGSWKESEDNVISIQAASPEAVAFLIQFLYGGCVSIPPSTSPIELLILADMYQIPGLKDLIVFVLKADFCHFFHKPCHGCISGVSATLPAALMHGLDELFGKCVKWVVRHMNRVWTQKTFATLPPPVLDAVFDTVLQSMTTESVLDLVMDARRLTDTLPRLKWAEHVLSIVTNLLDKCTEFIGKNFLLVLSSTRFIELGEGTMCWSSGLVEDILLSAVSSLSSPDHACDSYLLTTGHLVTARQRAVDGCAWSDSFVTILENLHLRCEEYLVNYVNHAIHCPGWNRLTQDMRDKIRAAAVFVDDSGSSRPLQPLPSRPSFHRRHGSQGGGTAARGAVGAPRSRVSTSSTQIKGMRI